MTTGRRLVMAALAVLALPVLFVAGWAGYASVTWLNFGHAGHAAPDSLLDHFMPVYEVSERHEIVVRAPPGDAFAAACALDLQQAPVIHAIFRGRELLLGAEPGADSLPAGLLPMTLRIGWRVLAEQPGRRIVVGAVTQPWLPMVVFQGLPPEQYAAFDSADYAKIIWTMETDSLGPSLARVRTQTRVHLTDAGARRKFRRYWSVMSPGIRLIRWQALRVARRTADDRFSP